MTNPLVIESPKPLPCLWLSSWVKELKMNGRNSFDIPLPLSIISNVNNDSLVLIIDSDILNVILPKEGVNLLAFPNILIRIWCNLRLSPTR